MTHGFLRGAQRHAQTNSDAPLGAAERLQALLRRKCASLDHSTARLTLGPAIYDFLTGRIREDPSEGLSNYVRANTKCLAMSSTDVHGSVIWLRCAILSTDELRTV